MATRSPVLRASDGYLSDLDRRANDAVARLLKRYGSVERNLLAAIDRLESQMAELESPTPAQLYRLTRYAELLRQVGVEMGDYGVVLSERTRSAIDDAIRLGAEAAMALGAASALDPAVRQAFTRFDPRTVEIAAGMTGPNSPLMLKLAGEYGAAWAAAFAETFVTNVALGRSPRDVVTALRQLTQVAARADIARIARTAQLVAYREANRQAWQQTGLVSGWIWHSALQPGRTCAACWAMHGTRHSVRETLDDHWNGLCSAWPILAPSKDYPAENIRIDTGEEIFGRMSRAEQDRIAESAGWGPQVRAWRGGAIRFEQLAGRYRDAVFGWMRVEASLKRLLGAERARAYYN